MTMDDPRLSLADSNLPPHSVEAEQTVLGAVLYAKTVIVDVAELLEPGDFYRGPHRYIYAAMLELFKLGEPIDIIAVSEQMSDTGTLEAGGGRPYLMDLAMSVATAENARYYAEIVKGYSLRRQLQTLGNEIVYAAQTESGLEVMEMAQSGLLKLATSGDKSDPTAGQLAQDALSRIENKLHYPNRVTGIKTGYPQLDGYIGGLREAKLIILGARPGMGKSALALNIATHVAVYEKRPVLFYSLEMEPVDMMERVLLSLAESTCDLEKLGAASQRVPDNLRIIDRPALNATQLRASIIKQRMEMKDLGLVVIDYLQLMKATGSNRTEEISGLTRELKMISREFKIPILCLSQLSRKVEERQDKRPMKSDLRESGSIEQDADTILLMYRDEYYNKGTEKPNIAEVIVDKNRDGKIGSFELLFRSGFVKFIDPETLKVSYAAY